MGLIRENDRKTLREMAEGMSKDVSLTLYTQRTSPLIVPGVVPCETCEAAEGLMSELSELMPRLNLTVLDLVANRAEAESVGVDRVPTLLFDGEGGGRVRFVGFPGGYEFPAFLKSVLEMGGAEQGLAPEARAQLSALTEPVDLKVFVTPT